MSDYIDLNPGKTINRLYNQDFFNFDFESGKFALIIADPPYGNVVDEEWDTNIKEYKTFTNKWLELCKRFIRSDGSIYVFCSIGPKSSSLLDIAYNLKAMWEFQDMIVWKKQRGRGNRKGWMFTREEILWATASKDYIWNLIEGTEEYDPSWQDRFMKQGKENWKYKRLTNVWTDINEVTIGNFNKEKNKHPCEKPYELMERIILSHTNKGDWVLDPFAGSGIVAYVCKKLERRCISVEIDKDYCEVIKQRCL